MQFNVINTELACDRAGTYLHVGLDAMPSKGNILLVFAPNRIVYLEVYMNK